MSERKDTCRFCGRHSVHGYGCPYGPNSKHIEAGDADHCIYCGSTNYGHGCAYSEEEGQKHKHGHGKGADGKPKCIWCGKTGVSGYGCAYSPDGKHHF